MSPTVAAPARASVQTIDRAVADLTRGAARFAATTLKERRVLVEACVRGVTEVAREWVNAACEAKEISAGSPLRAEEISAGPAACLRYLRLVALTLEDIERTGRPKLPGRPRLGKDGRVQVPVVPVGRLYDALVFLQFKAALWLRPGITLADLDAQLASAGKQLLAGPQPVALVLGAGNVSSIPATDAFTKLFQEGRVVLLKMNPVNEYLGPIFERAFAPLVDAGYLRIVYGGGDVGAAAVSHAGVGEVHITGSIDSHDAIVWGPRGDERERRQRENRPLLEKPITSELGNVSPWIVVPGPYSNRQLRFQAENIAASVTNNVSFNCVATKVVVTWKRWGDRSKFLDLVESFLARVPRRKAYYPGAADRYRKFAGREPSAGEPGTLPWTLIRDVDPDASPMFLREESFTPVFVEIALDADSPAEFLDKATDFVNERLWGTLCAALTVHRKFRREPGNEDRLQSAIGRLRYGAIAINHWPAMNYALMTPTWGGHPDVTLSDVQSGLGWVHNTLLVEGVEKSVLEGPLVMLTKPVWFPTHRNPEPIGWALCDLYAKPSLGTLTKLFAVVGKCGPWG